MDKLAAMMGIRNISLGARRALLAPALVAIALLAGCGSGDEDTTTTTTTTTASGGGSQAVTPGVYVGEAGDTGASVALVTDGQRLGGAYLCNSQDVSSWIKPAPLADGKAALIARRGDDLGEVTFSGESATGDVTAAGGSQSFDATLAKGAAGLYRTTSGKAGQPGFTETGWIVLPDGSVCGTTTTLTQSGSATGPAPSKPKGQITDYADPFPF